VAKEVMAATVGGVTVAARMVVRVEDYMELLVRLAGQKEAKAVCGEEVQQAE
jgi:hypothetical protein